MPSNASLPTGPRAPRSRKSNVRSKDSSRLDASAWTSAALDILESHGIDGVRVEVVAKSLKITKGSFYWHFRDRRELLDAMLNEWRRRATLGVIDRLESSRETPQERLEHLLRLPFEGTRAATIAHVELAIRIWGRTDSKAMDVLREIDELRLRYISGLFQEMGFDVDASRARAILAYSYMRVSRSLIRSGDKDAMARCEEVLCTKHVDLE